jgi:Skp family chaperone for outer membrane proteins
VRDPGTLALRTSALMAAAFLISISLSAAQESAPAAAQPAEVSLRQLDSEVRQLRAVIEEMRAENAQSRAEMRELRDELVGTRKLLAPLTATMNGNASSATATESTTADGNSTAQSAPARVSANPNATTSDLGSRVQRLEESAQLLGSKIDEQYQTKVETAAKYRARLSGIVLMNAFRNVGGSDNFDIPDYAQPVNAGSAQASFGATLRQTEIGLEIFGPTLAGARTSANVQFDFAGGLPATPNGVNFGIARMQTASLRLDWKQTSVIAGQDSLFISPLSPTSFASLATPAFAYAGNLWGWTPQLRVEHRFNLSDQQTLTWQGGILDNLDWEEPANSFYRSAQAGEASGQPAYAMRTAWSRPRLDHPLTFGVAGYYGRQNWAWDRYVDAWAGMADWQIPIVRRLGLSGEFYRGRAVGGLGGAVGQGVLYGGDPSSAYTAIRGPNSAGGWSQLKFQWTPKLELNGVVAEDNEFAGDVRGFATDANNFGPILGRNRGALGNVIYRPRSDLLLSAEFRRLHTFPVYDAASVTNQINLSMGILF